MCTNIMAPNDQKRTTSASLNLLRLHVKCFFERRLVCATFFKGCIQALIISVEGLLHITTAYLNRIATAVPEHDVHDAFVVFAEKMLADPRLRTVFRRMVSRANIAHRYSFLDPQKGSGQFSSHDAHEFYRPGNFPNTARRMELFEQSAPVLMRKAVDRLALNEKERSGITHVLVTCCTGLYAPGLDFEIVDHLGLSAGVERTMVGFMGCYAAINALKLARHIVRSDPKAGVLMVNLELCTLHFQETQELEQVLSFLVFADGAAASLITALRAGLCTGQLQGGDGARDEGADYVEDPWAGIRHAALRAGAGGVGPRAA